MTMRLDDATSAADPVVRGILGAPLAVQVDALYASGDRFGLGQAEPRTHTSFQEIPDVARVA